MLDPELLKTMCCPETYQNLSAATADMVERLNRHIEAGTVKNRAGAVVSKKIEAALVREDGKFLYPVRDNIPVMLVDEAIHFT